MRSLCSSKKSGQIMRIRVECYAGYRGEETPRRFWLGAKKIEVQDVLDRWMAPDHRYFKVLGHDKAVYILRHDAVTWDWDLTFYQQAGTPIDTA
jgi:hypothetical protein